MRPPMFCTSQHAKRFSGCVDRRSAPASAARGAAFSPVFFLILGACTFVAIACGGGSAVPDRVTSTDTAESGDPAPSSTTTSADPFADDPFGGDPFSDDPFASAPQRRVGSVERTDSPLDDAASMIRAGDFDGASAELRRLADDPAETSARAAYNLGVIAFAEGQRGQALAHFDDAMTRDPTLAEPLVAAIRVYLREGDVGSARGLADRQISRSSNAPAIRAAGLYVSLYEGRYEETIRQGREILLLDDANLDVFYTMGTANLRLGRTELARYIYQAGLERDAERPDMYFGLATLEIAAGNNPGARTMLNRALEADPHHPEAWNNLGVMLLESRNYSEAVDAFQNAARYAPDYREAWLNLGNALKGDRRYSEAQRAFERALAIDGGYADPYFNLGVMYLDSEIEGLEPMERYERSIAYFNEFRARARGLDPDHPVNDYQGEAQRLYDVQVELQSGSGDAGFGDDGFGDDGFGDDGFDDDWDDGFDDDGFEDDGFDDDGFDDDGFDDDGFDDDWDDVDY